MLQLTSKIPLWAYLLVALALTIDVFYIIARQQIPIDGIGSEVVGEQCTITAVRNNSPAYKSGLKAGDIITHVGLAEVTGQNQFIYIEDYRAGDTISYTIQRSNSQHTVQLILASFWSQHPWFYFVFYLIIFIISITSLFILYKKPFDRSARLYFIFLQLFAIAQNTRFLLLEETYVTIANVIFILSFNLFGVVLIHFHLLFPKPSRIYIRVRPLLAAFYAIAVMTGITLGYLIIMRNYYESIETATIFYKTARWSIAWMGFTLSLAMATAVYQFYTIRDAMARKQLRLVIIGSVFGIITPVYFSIFPDFFWRIEREMHLLTLVEQTNAAGSYIMIFFLFIAIFRYRMWDIEPFIRKAILYSSATAIILMTYFFIIFIVNLLAIQLTSPAHFIILAGSTFSFLLLRDVIQRLIDRLFQRETYDSAMAVAKFEEKLAGIYQFDELIPRICKELDDIFHVESINFFWKKSGHVYENLYHPGRVEDNYLKAIEVNWKIKGMLNKSMVFSFEEMINLPKTDQLPECNIIVPLNDNNDTSGFILLGNKMSEKSYTMQDIRVLTLLSRRIVALFNTADLYKKDLDRQLMLERERRRIAEDMHDDVGASLSRIAMLSEIAINNLEGQNKIKPWLGQISEISREVIDEMNQIIWALNPRNDTLDGLVAFIRRFSMEFFESSPIMCTIELPENLPDIALSVEVRRNIYLVVREALHNTLKHSGARMVIITLEITQNGFCIRIKDDGKGFDLQNPKYQGNGLQNMKKRMDDTGSGFIITSQPGVGTELELIIKIGKLT